MLPMPPAASSSSPFLFISIYSIAPLLSLTLACETPPPRSCCTNHDAPSPSPVAQAATLLHWHHPRHIAQARAVPPVISFSLTRDAALPNGPAARSGDSSTGPYYHVPIICAGPV
ncbi:hypothetical protein EDB84DRAFT_170720 [Lactarius hengduanensis]|nr:hypothetical protein EDB84DRAFT_170720 [Lactarius hengduanensis]